MLCHGMKSKQVERQKINLVNRELDVLPLHNIRKSSIISIFPLSLGTAPLPLQSLVSGPVSSFLLIVLLSLTPHPTLPWMIKVLEAHRCRIKASSQTSAERTFPRHLLRAHSCHLWPQCLTAQAYRSTFQPGHRWLQQEDGSGFTLRTFCTQLQTSMSLNR